MKRIICSIICILTVFTAVLAFANDMSVPFFDIESWGGVVYHTQVQDIAEKIGADDNVYTLRELGYSIDDDSCTPSIYIRKDRIIAVYKVGDVPMLGVLTDYENQNLRIRQRQLSKAEYEAFISKMNELSADSLTDWAPILANKYLHSENGGYVYEVPIYIPDGINYIPSERLCQYEHMLGNEIFSVSIMDPGSLQNTDEFAGTPAVEEDAAYLALVNAFIELTERGEFETIYPGIGGNVLISREEHNVKSVWSDGEKLCVCVDKGGGLVWKGYEGGNLGEVTNEPEGVTLQNAWADKLAYGVGFSFSEYYNTYPWQCTWNGYRVRRAAAEVEGEKNDSLYLTGGDEPVFVAEGKLSYPVVVGDYAICTIIPQEFSLREKLAKIDLLTHEVEILDFYPSDNLRAIVAIGGKVLVSSFNDVNFNAEEAESNGYWLYDPATSEKRRVDGCVPTEFKEHFLQSAGGENKYYYAATHFGSTVLGIVDVSDFTFEPVSELNFEFDINSAWVDRAAGKLYLVINGDLLEIDFAETDFSDFIRVYVKGRTVDTSVVNGTVMVPLRETLSLLSIKTEWNDGTATATANRRTVAFTVNSNIAAMNDVEYAMPEAAYIDNHGRLMVPLSFLAEKLALQITRYDDGAVNIHTNVLPPYIFI